MTWRFRSRTLASIGAIAPIALALPTPAEAGATLSDLVSVQLVSNVPLGSQLKAALELGVPSVRIGLRWGELETKAGSFDWRATDRKMQPILGSKLRPIITLFGGNKAYPGVEPPKGGVGGTPEAEDGFARFGAEVAKRYGVGTAERPIIYEIWNEPNTKTFWGAIPDPESYSRLALKTCRAIKAVNPGATVVALSTESTPVKTPYTPPGYGIDIYQEWSKRAYSPELAQCIDGVSMHPYRRVPESYLDDEPAFQRFLKASWSKPKPPLVVNSEWGYALKPDDPDGERIQAALDLRLILLGAGMGRVTNVYQAMNGSREPNDKAGSYGLFLYMGRAKPSGDAVKRLLQLAGSAEIGDVSVVEGQPNVFRFGAGGPGSSGSRLSIYWTREGEGNVTLPDGLASGGAKLVNLVTGAESAVQNPLHVTTEPTLLIER